jgi:hypothetical protein
MNLRFFLQPGSLATARLPCSDDGRRLLGLLIVFAGLRLPPERARLPRFRTVDTPAVCCKTSSKMGRRSKRLGEDRNVAMDRTTRPSLSASEHRGQLRRALIASTIGTTIEWYDFLLYSTVTGLVFAKIFFPASDPLIGTLQAYVIFYIGFIARPVGAAIFDTMATGSAARRR